MNRAHPKPRKKESRFVGPISLTGCLLLAAASPTLGTSALEVDAPLREAAVKTIARAVSEGYVFEDQARQMQTLLEQRLRDGAYDSVSDLAAFADRLTDDLRSINGDKHLSVRIMAPRSDKRPPSNPAQRRRSALDRMRLSNYGFERIERLPGNIGYVDLRGFVDPSAGRETAVAAMNFLASTDALIFDLRRNGGGSPAMIQLLSSYLLKGRVHLNSFYVRGAAKNEEFWTADRVSGPEMTDIPVYILTSSFTFSAAEEFTYNLKNLKRATVIGETTGGGAHPVRSHTFPELGLSASIPFGRAINPITETNWEGTGVSPHIKADSTEALHVAHTHASKQLLADKELSEGHRRRLEWTLEGLKATASKAIAPPEIDAAFGDRRIFRQGDALYYQRAKRPARKLLALGGSRYCFEDLESIRLTLDEDASGRPQTLTVEYPDGRTQTIER